MPFVHTDHHMKLVNINDTDPKTNEQAAPVLDMWCAAMHRSGLIKMEWHPATAPAVDMETTAWLKTQADSSTGEGELHLWDTDQVPDAYVPATPALFQRMQAFIAAAGGGSYPQYLTAAPTVAAPNGSIVHRANGTRLELWEMVAGTWTMQHDGSATIANGGITNIMLAADAVDSTKIADNAINSEHYVDGSIDNAHIANDAINSNKLADNAVNSEHYVNGSIDHDHLANNSVRTENIVNGTILFEDLNAGNVRASQAEVDAGTSNTKFVTPLTLENKAGASAGGLNITATSGTVSQGTARARITPATGGQIIDMNAQYSFGSFSVGSGNFNAYSGPGGTGALIANAVTSISGAHAGGGISSLKMNAGVGGFVDIQL